METTSSTTQVEKASELGKDPQSIARRWKIEIDLAGKPEALWQQKGKKIIKRYMDERGTIDASDKRFNILWSNIQTLKPAIFSRTPKPVAERRYLDKDPVGRLGSTLLERSLTYELDVSLFKESVNQAVMDWLLPGRGTVWVRYEPTFSHSSASITDVSGIVEDNSRGNAIGGTDVGSDTSSPMGAAAGDSAGTDVDPEGSGGEDDDNDGDNDAEVSWEALCVDYVHWQDFLHGPGRTWDEVTWVARRNYLTRDELEDRFKGVGSKVPLDHVPNGMPSQSEMKPEHELLKKATIWEIWDKASRQVIFISPDYDNAPLEVTPDPLKLEGFWPCPKPLFATLSNDSLVPCPDFVQYQDQADDIDTLTGRIAKLTQAIKAAGVYDASVPELRRLLEEGTENQLYPVDQWAAFAEKGGMAGALSLMPIKDMAEVLIRLYEARKVQKDDLYEITGLSDIIRGSTKASETATAQQIKSNFATLRLDDRKQEVSRFCRDIIRIMAELISEHFSPQTLAQIAGYEQYAREQFPVEPQKQPQLPPQAQQLPPEHQQAMMQQMQQQQLQQQMAKSAQESAQLFQAAIKLIRDDKLRGFRIDIEVDSTIDPDRAQEKQDRSQFIESTFKAIQASENIAKADPSIIPLLGKMLLFGVRAFPTARDLELSFEEWISKAEQRAANPPPTPPNPEQMKAQADAAKGQHDMKMAEAKQQGEAQKAQAELQMKAKELELKQAAEAQKVDAERMKMQLQVEKTHAELNLKREVAMEELKIKHAQSLSPHDIEAKRLENETKALDLEDRKAGRDHNENKREVETKTNDNLAAHSDSLKVAAETMVKGMKEMAEGQKAVIEGQHLVMKAIVAPKRLKRNPKTNAIEGLETIMPS